MDAEVEANRERRGLLTTEQREQLFALGKAATEKEQQRGAKRGD